MINPNTPNEVAAEYEARIAGLKTYAATLAAERDRALHVAACLAHDIIEQGKEMADVENELSEAKMKLLNRGVSNREAASAFALSDVIAERDLMAVALKKCRSFLGDPANFDCYGTEEQLAEFLQRVKRDEQEAITLADAALVRHESSSNKPVDHSGEITQFNPANAASNRRADGSYRTQQQIVAERDALAKELAEARSLIGFLNDHCDAAWDLVDADPEQLERIKKLVTLQASLKAQSEPVLDRDALADLVTGMEVSIDVSTCEEDSCNRYFGKVDGVVYHDTEKNGLVLLVQHPEKNFTTTHPAPADKDGELLAQACRTRNLIQARHFDAARNCLQDAIDAALVKEGKNP